MATAIATIPTLSKSPEKKVEKPKADGFTIKARMKNTAVSRIIFLLVHWLLCPRYLRRKD